MEKVVFFKKRSLFKRRGFTLIELMVVLVIITILMAVFYPRLKGRETSAKLTAAEAYVMRIWEAAKAWKTDNGYMNYQNLTDFNTLIDAGLADTKDQYSPFGTTTTITHTADNLGIQVSFDLAVDNGDKFCAQLAKRFQNHGYEASCTGSTITVTLKE